MRTLTAREQQILVACTKDGPSGMDLRPWDTDLVELGRLGYVITAVTELSPGLMNLHAEPTARGLLALRCQAALDRGGVA